VPADACAFPHRAPAFNVVISAQWGDAADDDADEAWLRRALDADRPYSSGHVYANALDRDENRAVPLPRKPQKRSSSCPASGHDVSGGRADRSPTQSSRCSVLLSARSGEAGRRRRDSVPPLAD